MSQNDPKRTLFALTAEAEAKRPAGCPYTVSGLSALRRTARRLPVAALFLWVVVVALQAPCRESARSVSDWFRTPAFTEAFSI
jgi:hypothetical protein